MNLGHLKQRTNPLNDRYVSRFVMIDKMKNEMPKYLVKF